MGGLFSSDKEEVDKAEYDKYIKDGPDFEKYKALKTKNLARQRGALENNKDIKVKYELLSTISNASYYMIFTMFSYIILAFCSHLVDNGLSNWVLITIFAILWCLSLLICFSDSDKQWSGIWGHSWGWLFAIWLIFSLAVVPLVTNKKPSFGPDLLGINELSGNTPISISFKDVFIKTKDEEFASKIVVIGLLLHILTIIYYSFVWEYPTSGATKLQQELVFNNPFMTV